MQKELEMMNEFINNYGYTGMGIIGMIGLVIIRYIFNKKKKKPLTYEQERMERLIDYELRRMPNQSRKEAKKLALERLFRDRK